MENSNLHQRKEGGETGGCTTIIN